MRLQMLNTNGSF